MTLHEYSIDANSNVALVSVNTYTVAGIDIMKLVISLLKANVFIAMFIVTKINDARNDFNIVGLVIV